MGLWPTVGFQTVSFFFGMLIHSSFKKQSRKGAMPGLVAKCVNCNMWGSVYQLQTLTLP